MALKVVALFVVSLFVSLNSYSADIEIPEGTVVSLEFLDLLSSGSATKGQKFNLEVVEDVLVDGILVAEAGVMAVGPL